MVKERGETWSLQLCLNVGKNNVNKESYGLFRLSNNSLRFEEHSISPRQTSPPPQSLPHQMKAIYWLSGIVSYLKYFLNAAEKETMSGKRRAGLADGWFALLIAVTEGCKEAAFSRKP